MSIQIECNLQLLPQRAARRRELLSREARQSVPRITRTLVLAHQIQRAVQKCPLIDYAEVARQIGVSRARVCQIIGLLRLAPAIQERILLGDPELLKHISEAPLRRIFVVAEHACQVEMFELLISHINSAAQRPGNRPRRVMSKDRVN